MSDSPLTTGDKPCVKCKHCTFRGKQDFTIKELNQTERLHFMDFKCKQPEEIANGAGYPYYRRSKDIFDYFFGEHEYCAFGKFFEPKEEYESDYEAVPEGWKWLFGRVERVDDEHGKLNPESN